MYMALISDDGSRSSSWWPKLRCFNHNSLQTEDRSKGAGNLPMIVDVRKIQISLQWSPCTTNKWYWKSQSFLGFGNHYSQFIHGYENLTNSLPVDVVNSSSPLWCPIDTFWTINALFLPWDSVDEGERITESSATGAVISIRIVVTMKNDERVVVVYWWFACNRKSACYPPSSTHLWSRWPTRSLAQSERLPAIHKFLWLSFFYISSPF